MLRVILFRPDGGFTIMRVIFSLAFATFLSTTLFCVSSPAHDAKGGYTVLKPDDSLKRSESKVGQALRRGFSGGDAALFVNVFDNYILPTWTQPANRHELPKLRGKFNGRLQNAKIASTRAQFNKHLLTKLPEIAAGNYHPAVRYNCMLLLGELDLAPPARFGDSATPLPEALPILIQAVADQGQIAAVKVAALVGIARHSHSLSDNAQRNRVSDAMLKLASTKSVPGTSSVAQTWMRCMAIETLGNLKSSGNQNATLAALLKIVDDAEEPLKVRCEAARAVGRLRIDNPAGLNADSVVRQLGRTAMAACKEELKQCEERNRTISPRKLKNQLLDVRMGLMGTDNVRDENPAAGSVISLLKKQKEKQNAAAIRKQIDRWLGMLDNENLIKKLELEQQPGARPGMGAPGMGGPGMGMEMGMGGPGMGRPGMGRLGMGTPKAENKVKKASDRVIEKIKASLEKFALLVQ